MTWPLSAVTITFLVLAVVVVVFIWDRLPVAIVALGVAIVLWATGVLDLTKALAGFGDPTVLFIAALFVVAEALDASGVTAWAGQQLLTGAGESRSRVMVYTLLLVALVTALITVNASVAALMPVIVVMAVRLRWPPSQLLMPLAFGAHAGSLLTLTGTPVNVIISDAAAEAGAGAIGFVEFAFAGVPLVVGTIAVIVLLGERLLPKRNAKSISRDFSNHAGTLTAQYGVTYAPGALLTRTTGVAEVVIPPRSGLVGETVFPGMVTERGDLVVLAIQRKGEELAGENALVVGDTLLLQGTWVALDRHLSDPNVLVVDHPELFRRQAMPLGPGSGRAVAVLVSMVVLLMTGAVPGAIAALLAAVAVVLMGVLTMEQAYRSIAWNTVVLVGGMIALSTAMIETGAARLLADGLVGLVGEGGPYALLAGLFVLTAVLGQLISNMATALIVIPIALTAAQGMGISPKPVLMSVAVTSAAALLTPVATPANLMVMGPGGYRFGDYWRLGLPLLLLYGVVAVVVVPVFWPF